MTADDTTVDAPPRDIATRAGVHAALGEPLRLQLVDMLRLGDLSPQWAARRLGISPSLLSHHLRTLREAGLVHATRSRGDGRRQYLMLDHTMLEGIVATPRLEVTSVLFTCTANSARSQLAEAMWRAVSDVPVASAGAAPAPAVHPLAVATASARGLDLRDRRPRGYAEVPIAPALVVSVCDIANESTTPFDAARLHWSLPDPADQATLEAFEDVADELARRVDRLAAAVVPTTG